jgi:WD40 repeat protein
MRLVKLKAMKRVNGLHFTPDGRRLLAVGGAEVRMQDEAVWIDVGKWEEASRFQLRGESYAVTPDFSRLALGNAHQFRQPNGWAVTLFALDGEPARGQLKLPVADRRAFVYGLAFSPDASRLAISFEDQTRRPDGDSLGVWRLADPKRPELTFDGVGTPVVVFDPTGRHVAASGGIDGEPEVKFLDLAANSRRQFKPKGSQTRHLVFSPDGGTLAVVNAKTVHLLAADSDVPRFTLVHPKQANAVAFTPDGGRTLSTCHDGLLRIWDSATGQLVTSFDWGIGQTTAVAVSPDGLSAAAAGQKGQIAVFDLD